MDAKTRAPEGGLALPARWIPAPKSLSPEARASLDRFAAARPPGAGRKLPDKHDAKGWAQLRAESEAMLTSMFALRAVGATQKVETRKIAGVTVHVATPESLDPARENLAYLDIHGGALIHGGGEPCRLGARGAATQHGVRAYAVDYRMPPEHCYPASLDDCVAVYRALLDRYRPENLIVGGGSAGGNLAAALMLRARDEGLPLPAAVVLLTPELDLTESGDSFEVNRYVDVVLVEGLMETNLLYADGHDLAHPYLSPLFGDFAKGFPPTYLQAGTRDLFLSNSVRMHRALLKARVPVELHVFEGMPHGGFFGAPEDVELAQSVREFVAAHWGKRSQA
jgi:acetyl esterase/lipase